MAKAPRMPKPTVIDFETFGIQARPAYPPHPVGVSIKKWGKPARYYAWGHVDGEDKPLPTNNCTKEQAIAALKAAYNTPDGVLFQNAKFDVEVAAKRCGLPIPDWRRVHDTMFLLFLHDPHQRELALKPSAERILGMPPDEQDAVVDWLVKNQPLLKTKGIKIGSGPASKEPPGKYIAYAPPEIVGPYANGDADRTEALFAKLWPEIEKRGMLGAYNREREFMPCILDMEMRGIRVDAVRLGEDIKKYRAVKAQVTAWVTKRLKAPPTFNIDSAAERLELMREAGVIDESKMGVTKKTGKTATDKISMEAGCTDKVLKAMLQYYSQLKTCLGTFMEPWLETAARSGGLIFTNWNQVRSPDGGTRTGRLSSSAPNFQNMPKEFAPIWGHEEEHLPMRPKVIDPMDKTEYRRGLPKCPLGKLPPLPLCRSYIIPFQKDHVLVGRDYCFSPDTEVLTEHGFVRFDILKKGVKLAQWNSGAVSFALPLAYQTVPFEGDLIHISGGRTADLLVTPSHNCLLLNEKGSPVFVKAEAYPLGHFSQVNAGVKLDGEDANPWVIKLAVALQADGTVKYGGDRLVWKMKKERKRAQLRAIFDALDIEYREVQLNGTDQVTITTRASFVPGLTDFIDLSTKSFVAEKFRALDYASRLVFLKELAYWDGRRNTQMAWTYFSTHCKNVDLACEIASFTGLRANMNTQELKSGKKFATVNLRLKPMTLTDTFTKTRVPYKGLTYCVTMPHSTVITRRNGKVMVTGQSQQEPRILAHFEDGELQRQYTENPWIDYHDNAKSHLERIFKRVYIRKHVKNINLGIIYGQGVPSLAVKNDQTVADTTALKKAIFALYPGLEEMYQDMKQRAAERRPFRTWGGREVFCEPPIIFEGKFITFDYKMLNYLIQGSAADCTKEAIIRYYRVKPKNHYLQLLVHDELVASVPQKDLHKAQFQMRDAMESVEFDVKILSEGAYSNDNWHAMRDFDRKGKIVA